ncbi:MAG: PQQ-binding-like beta-propeller repeat protein, partial [Melioribacteraceae bacterium]
MIETSDSGFVIYGNKGYKQGWLIKTDKNGDTLWTKTFYPSEEGEMHGYKVIEDDDGGYILLGAFTPGMEPEHELWLAKVDKNGNLEWSQNIMVTLASFPNYLALLKNEQGFFIAVTNGHPGGNFFIQTDSLGNQLWQSNTRFLNGDPQTFNSITFAVKDFPDSGYVLTGENMGNLMVANIDTAANEVWAREYERFTPSINTGNFIINDYDGGFILVGGTLDNENRNLFIVKTNKDGNKIWDKSYEYSFGKSIGLTTDNGYIVCGTKEQKVWLLKYKTAPIASITTDSIWIDNEWDGYVTNTLDGSGSSSPNGFTITNYEWNYKGNTVGTNTTLEINLPTGDNIIELKVTDEKGISNTVEYVVKVCSFILETNGAITSSISTINDSLFFASSTDDQIYCFNNNNQLEWTLSTGGDIQSTTTIGPNNNIYVGSGDTRLYCFDLLGNFKWDTPMGGVVSASPAITQERTIYVGTENNRLYSIDGNTGNINWNYLTNGAITSSASLSKLGNIYFGSNDTKFYSLNST